MSCTQKLTRSVSGGEENETRPSVAIIVPACDEAPCIARVLEELLRVVDPVKYVVAVGVNGSSDRTAEIAREFPVIVAETSARGYGYGCNAAIEAVARQHPSVGAYLFFAADGASDPRDISSLAAAYAQSYGMVLGARTMSLRNWRTMSFSHVLANFALGFWCGFLTRRWFTDLAPHRLIVRDLYEAIAPREMTFGWTIEAQIAAAILGARIIEVPAHERKRIAGEQKVSGVTWTRTFRIGCRIIAAGWRTRLRLRVRAAESQPAAELLAHSGRRA
jgi:glycosyltransferase involved in cell wall biosynthesis